MIAIALLLGTAPMPLAIAQAGGHVGHAAPATQPAAACPPEHAAMGHCTPAADAAPASTANTAASDACPPEHAAMGHCTPATGTTQAPPVARPPADAACPPEHAAMGHCTPATPSPTTSVPRTPVDVAPVDPDCPPEHAAMGHCTPAAAPARPGGGTGAVGTALAPGDAPAPAPVAATYADRIWGADAMTGARDLLRREHGGGTFSQVMIDIAEVQFRRGREGYRWEGESWFGGDINRLVVKSEGEGGFGEGVESGEVQGLYSRAIGPYFNLQGGVRHDFRPSPSRTYLAAGIEGLAPYWFELEAHGFVSTKGDVLGRIAVSYDQRITQRLILQPRAELNLSAQDVPEIGLGSGVTDAELDLRLRYEFVREFAPYVGVSWERRFGDTARASRMAGEGTGGFRFVAGVRAWF